MKYLNLLFILFFVSIFSSCSLTKSFSSKQSKTELTENEDLVSLNAALNHAQASYLKGCVDALKKVNVSFIFKFCRQSSLQHRKEIESFVKGGVQIPSPSLPNEKK